MNLDQPLFTIGDTTTTLGALLLVCGIVIATILVGRVVGKAVSRSIKRLHADDSEAADVYGFAVKLIVWFVGLELVLHLLGITLSSLLAASGFLALAAGFAAKNIVENFLSGGILRLEKTIRPGDIIIVNERWIVIQKINIRVTEAKTYEGEDILIPNSLIAQSVVENLTRHDRQFRIDMKVGVAYESDLALVRKTLEETVDKLEWRLQEKQPGVFLVEYGDSSINYLIILWIENVDDSYQRKSDLLEAVWWALKDRGITVAHPQLDLHLDPELISAVTKPA